MLGRKKASSPQSVPGDILSTLYGIRKKPLLMKIIYLLVAVLIVSTDVWFEGGLYEMRSVAKAEEINTVLLRPTAGKSLLLINDSMVLENENEIIDLLACENQVGGMKKTISSLYSRQWITREKDLLEDAILEERLCEELDRQYTERECLIGEEVTKYYDCLYAIQEEQNKRILEKTKAAEAVGLTYTWNEAFAETVSDEERQCLYRIVQAEAGGEDQFGKVLVANVILNRVISGKFPNTIEGVVFAKGQFSPVSNGRYARVKVSEATKEAVDLALSGDDYSKGALYFFARKYTSKKNAAWFDNCLTKVVKYEVHEFYK